MNLHVAQLLFVVHTHLGLKSQADSESPLKWTVMGFCNYIEKILAIAQLIKVHIYQFQSILISVRFNALELLARNLFPGGKTTQNRRRECEEFRPCIIDQQYHKFPGGRLGLLRMEGIQ
jgi:hypothetical protein